MADVVEKADPSNYLLSVNTDDYPPALWLINPAGLPVLLGTVDPKYWKLNGGGDDIEEMTQPEKDTVDANETAAELADRRSFAADELDDTTGEGIRIRALIELFNKRDNYLVNRITELQAAMDAMKASNGGVSNLRDAIPASWLATNTRTKFAAVTEYKDDINAGNQDT